MKKRSQISIIIKLLIIILSIMMVAFVLVSCKNKSSENYTAINNGNLNGSAVSYRGTNSRSDFDSVDQTFWQVNYANMKDSNNNNISNHENNYIYYLDLADDDEIPLYSLDNFTIIVDGRAVDYVFEGWYSNSACTDNAIITSLYKNDFNPISDSSFGFIVTIYAKWVQYPAIFIDYVLPNGAQNNSNNPEYVSGSHTDIILSAPTPPPDTDEYSYTFEGWYLEYDEDTGVYSEQVVKVRYDLGVNESTGRITLYARFEVEEFYTLKFVLNSEEDSPVELESSMYSFITTEDGMVLLRTERNGTIKLKENGIYNIIANKSSKKFVDKNDIEHDLVEYTFAGWYSSSLSSASPVEVVDATAGSRTVYARYTSTKVGFYIDYELDFGVNHIDNLEWYAAGSRVSLQAPTRESVGYSSYEFEAWYKIDPREIPEGESLNIYKITAINDSASETSKIKYTVYANWTSAPKSFNIEYDLCGTGSSVFSNTNPSTHSSDVTLIAPSREPETVSGVGYKFKFDGWYLGYSNGNYTDRITLVKAQNVKVYAKWERCRIYDIQYIYNGGQPIENRTNVSTYSTADGDIELNPAERESTESRIIYIFDGWYYAANEEDTEFRNDHLVSKLDNRVPYYDVNSNGIIYLLAKWTEKPDTYTITYNLGAGVVNSKENPTFTSRLNTGITLVPAIRETITANSSNYTITSYAFAGWWTEEEGGVQVTEVSWTDGQLDLWPRWGTSKITTVSKNGSTRVNQYKQGDNNGGYVLFGEYPQTEVENTSDSNFTYVQKNEKYYRVEPILWKIVNETSGENGTLTLVSTIVLDNCVYNSSSEINASNSTYTGSNLDTYMTTTFYNTAFRAISDGNKIKDMSIDGNNKKVAALSSSDVSNYLGEDKSKTASDYAVACGAYEDNQTGLSAYWTRTKKEGAGVNTQGNSVPAVNIVGARDNIGYVIITSETASGVVPIIVISK